MRGATEIKYKKMLRLGFQSTRPMRGATLWGEPSHAPLKCFNPRAPCGARPICGRAEHHPGHCFNPRAPCGARHGKSYSVSGQLHVSIHAPHAGRDFWILLPKELRLSFNPRAPCGARPILSISKLLFMPFQSTRPMRGATCLCRGQPDFTSGFNPRAPCGARRRHFIFGSS